MAEHRSVCLIAAGLHEHNRRLQPWRYLHEVARQLMQRGHRATIISDGRGRSEDGECVDGVPVLRVESVRTPTWSGTAGVAASLLEVDPQVILWHAGTTSFLHQRVPDWKRRRVVGIFTSPIHSPRELLRPGAIRLCKAYRLSALHILGTLAPKALLRRAMNGGGLTQVVVQTMATRTRLVEHGVEARRIEVIPPGVDDTWNAARGAQTVEPRAGLGFDRDDIIVVYFGSPAPLRGLHTLVRAIGAARQFEPSLKLLILSRRHRDQLLKEDAELRQLLARAERQHYVRLVTGFLGEQELVRTIAASDIAALPFEIIPSDAPLSLLEAQALGKPIVTTRLGCLPELVAHGHHYLAEPASVASLAQELRQAAADLRSKAGDFSQSPRPAPARTWREMGLEWSNLIQRL